MTKHWILKKKKLTEKKVKPEEYTWSGRKFGRVLEGKERDHILEIFDRSQKNG